MQEREGVNRNRPEKKQKFLRAIPLLVAIGLLSSDMASAQSTSLHEEPIPNPRPITLQLDDVAVEKIRTTHLSVHEASKFLQDTTSSIHNAETSDRKIGVCTVEPAFDMTHEFFIQRSDQIAAEACFSGYAPDGYSACANGKKEMYGPLAAHDARSTWVFAHGTMTLGRLLQNPDIQVYLAKTISHRENGAPTYSTFDIERAVQWCLDMKLAGEPIDAVMLTSGSISTFSEPCNSVSKLDDEFEQLHDEGVMTFTPTGNYGELDSIAASSCVVDDGHHPLADGNISVTAADGSVLADYSNYADGLTTMAAPGSDDTTFPKNGYVHAEGTSMAVPDAIDTVTRFMRAMSFSDPRYIEERISAHPMRIMDSAKGPLHGSVAFPEVERLLFESNVIRRLSLPILSDNS